jgi:hypothetical protein
MGKHFRYAYNQDSTPGAVFGRGYMMFGITKEMYEAQSSREFESGMNRTASMLADRVNELLSPLFEKFRPFGYRGKISVHQLGDGVSGFFIPEPGGENFKGRIMVEILMEKK